MKRKNIILTIARKEFVTSFRTRLVLLLGTIIWILLAIAMYTGLQRQKDVTIKKERATSLFRHEWEEQEANPHSAAHFGTYLFKPNTFLSVYDYGLNKYLGISYRVEAHVQHELNQAEAEATDSQLRFGELTVAVVFQLVVPLLILLICFNSITSEREGNTLRLLLMQGVRPSSLIWGKILGQYAIVVFIILPALIAMGIPVLLQDNAGESLLRYGLFAGIYLVYFFLFVSIGVLISAWSKSSAAALVSGIGVWFLLTILLPRVVMRTIDANDRLPSRYELNRNISQGYSKGMDQDGSSTERYKKYLDSTLKKYGVDSVAKLPVNFDGLSMQYGEDYNAKVYEYYAGKVERVIKRQQTQLEQVSLLDPFIAVQQISMGLTGTDYAHHLSFHHQAKSYRDEFVRVLNMELANSGSAYLSYNYQVGPEFFKKMKDFTYSRPGAANSVNWHHWAWISLGAWCFLTVLLVTISARRLN